jgi:hypothetical protein
MKVTNTTSRDLGLSPECVVPSRRSIEIDAADMSDFANSPVVEAWLDDGSIVVDDTDEQADAPELSDRQAIVAGIIRGLAPEDFTDSGEPKVGSINKALPKSAEPVTSQERTMVWDLISDTE